MECSNCGEDVPYEGTACPWCHADKSADKRRYLYAVIGAVTGAVGGLLASGLLWSIGGAFLGGVVGGATAIYLTNHGR